MRRRQNIRRADWDYAYRERIASERRRKLRRKKLRAEAARRRMRWYILPDGTWQWCDPRKKPAGALRPKAALKRQQEAALGGLPGEANIGAESSTNPSFAF